VILFEESFGQMGAKETCAAGDEDVHREYVKKLSSYKVIRS
jgi:hypothetical protein